MVLFPFMTWSANATRLKLNGSMCMNVSVYYCMYLYLFLLPYVCPYLFEPVDDDGQIKQQAFICIFCYYSCGLEK